MKTESTFLHSKLARRILWLFVLSALIPMTVLAVISLRNVTAQLQEQSRLLLHQVSRDEAMSIMERLSFLKADIELAAFSIRENSGKSPAHFSIGSSGPNSNFTNLFKGLALVTPDGNCQAFLGGTQNRNSVFDCATREFEIGRAGLFRDRVRPAHPVYFYEPPTGCRAPH